MEGAAGVVPPPGAADSPAPSGSGHASSRCKPRSGREAEASPAEAHPPPVPLAGGAGGTKGRPPQRSPPHWGSRLSQYKRSGRKIPRGDPAAGEGGQQPRPGPPPSGDVRQRARLPASIFAPPPARQGGTPIVVRCPRGGVGSSCVPDWSGRAPTDQWGLPQTLATPPSGAGARPLYPVRARSRIPAPSARAAPRGRRRL